MEIRKSAANLASFAIESRFIGQFAWFADIQDGRDFLESLGESVHEDHWKIVELI